MPETLTLNLTPRTVPPEEYWIALQQIIEPEAATYEEAAEVIDTVFDMDPCVSAEEKDELQPEDESSWEEKIDKALERYEKLLTGLQESLCPSADGCFTVQVKLFRSHQDKTYTLLPQGCTITQTITGNVEPIRRSVPVKNATALSLDLPADQPISASWSGPCYTSAGRLETNPEITSNRGRVYWDAAVDGVIALSYSLPYELLTIETDSEDAALTALYHLSVDQITLEPPHVDDAAEDLCEQIGNKLNPLNPDETGSCLAETLYRWLCDCSGKTADLKRVHTDVPCPEGVAPGNIVSRQDVVEYISCPADEDEINDPDYYLDKCCTGWPFPGSMPRCRTRKRTWSGKGLSAEKRAELMRTYGPNTQIVLVGPDPPPCGVVTYEQDVNAKNCCDGVIPITTLDADYVVGDHSYIDIAVAGGVAGGPFIWKVRHVGAYFDASHTKREAVTVGRGIRVYTTDVCGTISVQVTDGCTSAIVSIRAEDGQWVLVEAWEYADFATDGTLPPQCVGGVETIESNTADGQRSSFTNGAYLYRENIDYSFNYYWGGSPYTGDDPGAARSCSATMTEVNKKQVPMCASIHLPVSDTMDAAKCTADPYCFVCDAGRYIRYVYRNGPWAGYGPNLSHAWLYRWEC